MNYSRSDSELIVTLDKVLYSETVIFKCFYWYSGQYNVQISRDDAGWSISIRSKQGGSFTENLESLEEKIKRDLIDFKLREIVNQETKVVRELIIAKAFSQHETDDDPQTDITDPVGFNPQEIFADDRPLYEDQAK